MRLVTEDEVTQENAKLLIWQGGVESKGTWWYLEAVDGELQSASLGKAPAP